MTKKEKLAFIEALKKNPRISDVQYLPDILKRGREDSIWYDNTVLCFLVDNRYRYFCRAIGEVRLTHIPTNDDVVSKGGASHRVRDFLETHNLTTDRKISKAEQKGELYFGNNNWFEDEIWDNKKHCWVTLDNAEISEGPFAITLEYIDELINYYLKETK